MQRLFIYAAIALLGILSLSAQQLEGEEPCGFDQWLLDQKANTSLGEFELNINQHLKQQRIQGKLNASQQKEYVIPVVVHVLHPPNDRLGTGYNLSDAYIQEALAEANRSFAGQHSQADDLFEEFAHLKHGNIGIRFELARQDQDGLATNGIVHVPISNYTNLVARGTRLVLDNMHIFSRPWDQDSYFNIWVAPGTLLGGLGGQGSFPISQNVLGVRVGISQAQHPFGAYFQNDGVLVRTDLIASASFDKNIHNNPTNTVFLHEIGHCLGLYHTFQGGCSGTDYCRDTPAISGPTRVGCDITRAACDETEFAMVQNMMDYGSRECTIIFTPDQVNRMRAVLETSKRRRKLWESSKALQPPSTSLLSDDVGFDYGTSRSRLTLTESTLQIQQINVKNFGSNSIRNFVVSYRLDNEQPTTYPPGPATPINLGFPGRLLSGEEGVILYPTPSFDTLTFDIPPGKHTITFEISEINGNAVNEEENKTMGKKGVTSWSIDVFYPEYIENTSEALDAEFPVHITGNNIPANWFFDEGFPGAISYVESPDEPGNQLIRVSGQVRDDEESFAGSTLLISPFFPVLQDEERYEISIRYAHTSSNQEEGSALIFVLRDSLGFSRIISSGSHDIATSRFNSGNNIPTKDQFRTLDITVSPRNFQLKRQLQLHILSAEKANDYFIDDIKIDIITLNRDQRRAQPDVDLKLINTQHPRYSCQFDDFFPSSVSLFEAANLGKDPAVVTFKYNNLTTNGTDVFALGLGRALAPSLPVVFSYFSPLNDDATKAEYAQGVNIIEYEVTAEDEETLTDNTLRVSIYHDSNVPNTYITNEQLWTPLPEILSDNNTKAWEIDNEQAGNKQARIDFFGTNEEDRNKTYQIISPRYDLRASADEQLTFRLAYGLREESTQDSLFVYVQRKCQETFDPEDVVYKKGGASLNTLTDDQQQSIFAEGQWAPTAQKDWREETIDLSRFGAEEDIHLIIVAKNGLGNDIYLDNIAVQATSLLGTPYEIETEPLVTIQPNPAQNGATSIRFNLPQTQEVSLSIIDLYGREVYSQRFDQVRNETIPVRPNIPQGQLYLLRLQGTTFSEVQRFLF